MSEQKTLLAVLSYIGPFIIISYAFGNNDPFVKYHIKQGLVLIVIDVVVWLLGMFFIWQFWMIYQLLNLVILVLAIIGIINAAQGKEKELPFVGQYAHNFKI